MRLVISAAAEVFVWEGDEDEEDSSDEELEDEYEDLDDDEVAEDEEYEDDDDDEEDEDGEEEQYELEDDSDEEEADEVTDPAILISLSDIEFDGEKFTEHLFEEEGTEILQGVGVTGGTMSFEYSDDDEKLWGYTDYDVSRELDDDELQALIDFTLGQWSDGIGHQFATEYAEETGYFIQMIPLDDEVDYYYEAE